MNNTYLAAVVKTWPNNFEVHWVLHDIKFKTEKEALQVAQNYIDKIIYGQ